MNLERKETTAVPTELRKVDCSETLVGEFGITFAQQGLYLKDYVLHYAFSVQ